MSEQPGGDGPSKVSESGKRARETDDSEMEDFSDLNDVGDLDDATIPDPNHPGSFLTRRPYGSFLSRSGQEAESPPPDPRLIPVAIYLTDEGISSRVEFAVYEWLATADLAFVSRGAPIIGSWLRYIQVQAKKSAKTPAARDALLTATHVADSHLVQTQDAYVTATLLQNVGPVLQALQPTKDAVVRAGALLIVKIDWVVQVHQLTAAQQATLDHQSHLVASPKEIATALRLSSPVSEEASLPSSASWPGGEAATTAD